MFAVTAERDKCQYLMKTIDPNGGDFNPETFKIYAKNYACGQTSKTRRPSRIN